MTGQVGPSISGPAVSVVMANHNGARHLAEAVRSVLGQTLLDLELIVVDDASTDDSLAVAAAASGGDPRLRLLAQPANGGPSAARNRALDEARGRWLAIVDSDDLLVPDRLTVLLLRAEAQGADLIADDLEVFADDGSSPARGFLPDGWKDAPRWIGLADFVRAGAMYGEGPDLGFLKPMISRAALGDLRYAPDLRIGEDYDLVARLLARGARYRLVPQALYRYRKHSASISHRLSPERIGAMLDAQRRFVREAGPFDAEVTRALAARRRSLETARVYEQVVAGLKSGAVVSSLARGLAHPHAWPQLTVPLQNRLRAIGRA